MEGEGSHPCKVPTLFRYVDRSIGFKIVQPKTNVGEVRELDEPLLDEHDVKVLECRGWRVDEPPPNTPLGTQTPIPKSFDQIVLYSHEYLVH